MSILESALLGSTQFLDKTEEIKLWTKLRK